MTCPRTWASEWQSLYWNSNLQAQSLTFLPTTPHNFSGIQSGFDCTPVQVFTYENVFFFLSVSNIMSSIKFVITHSKTELPYSDFFSMFSIQSFKKQLSTYCALASMVGAAETAVNDTGRTLIPWIVYLCSTYMHAQSCLTLQPHGLRPARFLCPWNSPGKKYWSGLPFPPPEDLPNPGIQPASLVSPASAGGFFTTCATWEEYVCSMYHKIRMIVLHFMLSKTLILQMSKLTHMKLSVMPSQASIHTTHQFYQRPWHLFPHRLSAT